jgi:hypothetical protein
LQFYVDAPDTESSSHKREGILLDLSTLLRDNLNELRVRLLGGKKSEAHLFRLGDEWLNMNLGMSRQCVVEGGTRVCALRCPTPRLTTSRRRDMHGARLAVG